MAQYTDEYGRTFQAHVSSDPSTLGQVTVGGQVIGYADPITQRYIIKSSPLATGELTPLSARGYEQFLEIAGQQYANEIALQARIHAEERERAKATEANIPQEQYEQWRAEAAAKGMTLSAYAQYKQSEAGRTFTSQYQQQQERTYAQQKEASLAREKAQAQGYTEEEARQFSIAATGTPINYLAYMGKVPEKYGKLTGEEGPGLPRTPTSTPLRAATGEVTGMQIATAQRRLGAEYGYLEQRRGRISETSEAEQFNREVEQYNRNVAAFGGMATLYNTQEQEKFNKQLEEAGYTYSPAPLPYTPIGGGYGFAPVAIKTEPLYTPKEGGFASMVSGETALIQYGTQEEIGKASFEDPTTYYRKFGLLPEGIKYAIERKTPEGGKTYELYQEQEGKDVLVGYKEFGAIRPQVGKQTLQESIRANVYDIGAKAEAADPFKAFLDKAFDYAIYTQKNDLLRGGLQGTKGFFSFFTPSFQVQTFAAMAGTGATIGADFLTGDYKATATGFKRGTEETIKMFVVPEQFVGTVAAGAGFIALGALAPTARGTAARYTRGAEPEILLTPNGNGPRPNIYEGRLGETGFKKSAFAPSEGFASETQRFSIQAQQKIKPFFGEPTEIYVKGIADVTARTQKTNIVFETQKGFKVFEGSIAKVIGEQEAFITRAGQETIGRTPKTISTLELSELERPPQIISEKGIRTQVPKQRAVELETGAQIRFGEPNVPRSFVQQFKTYYELPEGGIGRAMVYLADRRALRPPTEELSNIFAGMGKGRVRIFAGMGKGRVRAEFGIDQMFDIPAQKRTPFRFEEPKSKEIELQKGQRQIQIQKSQEKLIKATTKQTTKKLKQAYEEYVEEAYRGKPMRFGTAIGKIGMAAFTNKRMQKELQIKQPSQLFYPSQIMPKTQQQIKKQQQTQRPMQIFRESVMPIIRPAEIQRPMWLERAATMPKAQEIFRAQAMEIQRPSEILRTPQILRPAQLRVQLQRPLQIQRQLQTMRPIPPATPMPPIIVTPPPPIIGLPLVPISYQEWGRAIKTPRGRKFKYSPSLIALALGITKRGKQPKESYITVGEIRPIYIGEAKRKRRR